MRQKIYNVMKQIYGITMSAAFFGGILPLVPFIVAICIGGDKGTAISTFLYNQYYPWVIALASIAIIIGLITMYIGKQSGLSVNKINAEQNNETKK